MRAYGREVILLALGIWCMAGVTECLACQLVGGVAGDLLLPTLSCKVRVTMLLPTFVVQGTSVGELSELQGTSVGDRGHRLMYLVT